MNPPYFTLSKQKGTEYLITDNLNINVGTIAKYWDLKDTILNVLNQFNYSSVEQAQRAIEENNFDFARALYAEFGMCDKKDKSNTP